MRKFLCSLLCLVLVLQLTGCTRVESLSQNEAKKLLDTTISTVEEQLLNNFENLDISIDYGNLETNCFEYAYISQQQEILRYICPDYELNFRDNYVYKVVNHNKITKKEYKFNNLTLPKLAANTEVLKLIYELLAGDCISGYSAEIYDYDNYNLIVTLDRSKIKKSQLPFNTTCITIRSTSLLKEDCYDLYSVRIEFLFSKHESVTYVYSQPDLVDEKHEFDNAIYDPNLTFELPNHDHLLNK